MGEKTSIAVVVIGRNEGARLKACFDSIIGKAEFVVYVDSASSDGSVELARSYGIDTIELDNIQPYTAARSRNAGFRYVQELMGNPEFVQFVDGDCMVDPAWLEAAATFLLSRKDVAVICGRLKERFPDKTVYNLLCDIEWDRPTGETEACGGNAFMRTEVFLESGGFREDLIAGEEPELCVRLRKSGWTIWRLPNEMVLHDADMTQFSQWWTRSVRTGYTFAEGAHRLGRNCDKERNRALIWGLILPIILIMGSVLSGPMFLMVCLVYPLQVSRLALRETRGLGVNLTYAGFEVLGRFPEMAGVLKYYYYLITGKTAGLMEYKKPLAAGSKSDKNEN